MAISENLLYQMKSLTHFVKTIRHRDFSQGSSKIIYYGTPLFILAHFEEDVEWLIPIDSCS
jgi:hypothetical protein